METQHPTVSVLMPSYNAEKYIESAVRSALAQTFTDFELLVLDDCSTDGTVSILKRLAQEDSRIRILSNEVNLGVAKTRNRGIELCRGEYIALLDSDDLWYPEKLEKQLALARSTGSEILYCSYDMIDEAGQPRGSFAVPERTDFDAMLVRSVLSCSTVLLKRDALGDIRFDPSYYHEDYVFWLALLQRGLRASGIAEPLGAYRVMSGSRSANKLTAAKYRWQVYRDYLHYPLLHSGRLFIAYALAGVRKYSG